MDFLTLIIVYCLLFIAGSLCILYRDAEVLNRGPIGALRNIVLEVSVTICHKKMLIIIDAS